MYTNTEILDTFVLGFISVLHDYYTLAVLVVCVNTATVTVKGRCQQYKAQTSLSQNHPEQKPLSKVLNLFAFPAPLWAASPLRAGGP